MSRSVGRPLLFQSSRSKRKSVNILLIIFVGRRAEASAVTLRFKKTFVRRTCACDFSLKYSKSRRDRPTQAEWGCRFARSSFHSCSTSLDVSKTSPRLWAAARKYAKGQCWILGNYPSASRGRTARAKSEGAGRIIAERRHGRGEEERVCRLLEPRLISVCIPRAYFCMRHGLHFRLSGSPLRYSLTLFLDDALRVCGAVAALARRIARKRAAHIRLGVNRSTFDSNCSIVRWLSIKVLWCYFGSSLPRASALLMILSNLSETG